MNELFKDYAKHHPGINYQFNKQKYEVTSKAYYKIYGDFLPKDKYAKILDIGCGTGHFLYILKKLGYTNYWGIDISKESVQFCIEHITKNVQVADGYEFLQGHKNNWNLIVMNDVIEHIPKEKIVPILKLVYSSLTPGAVFIVKTPNMDNPFCVYTRHHNFTHEIGFNGNSLIQVLKMSSFNEVSIYPYEDKKSYIYLIRKALGWIIWRLISLGFSFPPEKNKQRIIHTKLIFAVAKKSL